MPVYGNTQAAPWLQQSQQPTADLAGQQGIYQNRDVYRQTGPYSGRYEQGQGYNVRSDQLGLPETTPGGERIPGQGQATPYGQFSSFVQQQYGMNVQSFLGAGEQERIDQYYETQGSPYDEEGLPSRAPRSPYEAGEFMFQTADWARKRAMQDQQAEIAALQYAIGLSFQAPGSLAALQSPYIGQMANAYRSREYSLPDYSLYMLPQGWRS